MNILRALDDPKVFAPFFRGDSWSAWRVFLSVLFALPLSPAQLAIYQQHTGRSTPPSQPSHEAWLVCGRRSGKSFVLAVIAVFLASFRDWRPHLGPGERGTIMVIAADRRQARTIMRYVTGLLRSVPMLEKQIESETQERVDLRNGITIEVHTASFRSTRGYAIVAGLLDELAFWPTDEGSSESDVEVINALRPGQATIPGSMLLCASSPYARRGALFDAHRKHYGRDGDPVLVWHAPTRDMNPRVPQTVIDEAMQRDPAHAAAEYLAQFRADVEGFVALEIVEGCVGDYREMLPAANNFYRAFTDPSGGSDDSFALAISHKSEDRIIIDAIREARPPFSPDAVVDDFAALLKSYRVSRVTGDRYAGEFPRELFRKHGIAYELAKQTKSELFRDLLPLLNSGRIVLPRNDRLQGQIVGLERRTSAVGRDTISHPDRGHDDVANAVAGAAYTTGKGKYAYDTTMQWVG